MTTTPRAGLSALLRRVPTDAEPDADLVERFVQTRDEAAFTAVVRRHGPMVLGVCRRRLGHSPDAEDAFQVTFLALARDAHKLGRRESLAGWLYRVAYLSALKASGRVRRRPTESLATDPAAPMPTEPDAELKAVIDDELTALPDKFRSVAVLCLVEGRTNTEAAAALGIPTGTVDSRLHAARTKLRDRLLRRGVTAAALAAAEPLLESATAAATARASALAIDVTTAALAYAAGTPVAGLEHLTTLADGVNTTMNGTTTRWLAAALLGLGLVGGLGVGLYQVTAGDKPPADKKADPAKPPKAEVPKGEGEKPKGDPARAASAEEVHTALKGTFGLNVPSAKFDDLVEMFEKQHGVSVRFDTPAFVRRGFAKDEIQNARNAELNLHGLSKSTVGEALREVLGQMSSPSRGEGGGGPFRLSYTIRGSQVLIVPEFIPANVPGNPEVPQVSPSQLLESIFGEPVTVRYKNKTLAEIVEDLQERTGANIVVNAKGIPIEADRKVSANFNDARLLTVLKIVGDMYGLKPVVIDNVFYLTDPDSAAVLQSEVDRNLFGTPPAPPVVAKPGK